MEYSSQQQPPQPSQLASGRPQGNPLRREHLHHVDSLRTELQDRQDRILMRAQAA